MIKRNVAAGLAALLLATAACTDEAFLSEVPEDFIGPENFFRNAEDAIAAVNGVYASFNTPLGYGVDSYYGRNFYMLVDYPGEALTSRYGAAHDRGSLDAFNYTVEHEYLATVWGAAYSAIGSANAVIANVPNIQNMDPALRDRVVAEARFLRAIHYFNLVRLWGDVPLQLDYVTSPRNLEKPRSPAADVYAAIVADLDFAAEKLPVNYAGVPGANVGRATRGAANALLAKVHLQQALVHGGGATSLTASIAAAKRVTAAGTPYRLLDDFGRVFALDNEMNLEVIFAIQNTRVSGMGGRLAQHVAPIGSGLSGANAGGVSFYAEWPFYRDWPAADARKAATWLTSYTHPTRGPLTWTRPGMTSTQLTSYGTPGGGPSPRKYLDPQALTGGGEETDYILLRYADVLLTLAEASNELNGPTAEAFDAVDEVRRRAKLPVLSRTLNQEQLRYAIQMERRYELVLEGHAFFDMQRHWAWAKARVEAHIKAGQPLQAGDPGRQNLNASPWGNSVPKVGTNAGLIDDKYKFYPIPSAALKTNKALTQTPAWAGTGG